MFKIQKYESSEWTIISTNHSTLCGSFCEIFYLDQYTAIMLDKERWAMHTSPPGLRQKLKPLCVRGKQEMLKRTCHVCASKNTYVEILLCLYRECFATKKK